MYGTEQPPEQPPELPMPDPRASHAAWVAYAVSHGMPTEEARGRTRDQLRASFPCLIGAVPDLERHHRDDEPREGS